MDTLSKILKIDELLILTTDEREKVSFGRYWGNKPDSLEKAHADMLEMWRAKKGEVVYLFRLERIVKASDFAVTVAKPVESVSLTKEHGAWRVDNV
jgi:hypothetical protein